MATIQAKTEERIFTISKWLGLNENPDGDTKLRDGEATVCKNWKVTRDHNLRRRPGTRVIANLGETTVNGLWSGTINGKDECVAACDGHLWKLWDADNLCFYDEPIDLGTLDTSERVNFFPFAGIVYILNGKEYNQYDGGTFKRVDGYRPLIMNGMLPSGEAPSSTSMLEEVNKLTGARRVWYSPDGESTIFHLPEQDVVTIDYVKNNTTNELFDPDDYSVDTANGLVTFDTAPEASTDSIEIGYTGANTSRMDITRMTNAELYLGSSDTAVMLYGDGSNEIMYSSIDYWGQPRADYFPDLNEIAVSDSNTPVTGLIRHYGNLICFKPSETYAISFGLITTASGLAQYGFYLSPINRIIGNVALGQVRQVLNSPRTLHGNDLYEWRNNASYASNLNRDERQAKRMSDRIYATLSDFDLPNCFCFDNDDAQEYYICNSAKKEALVHNYAADAWYYYDHFDVNSAAAFLGNMYFGTSDGKVLFLTEDEYADSGDAFESVWESGSMDFGKPFERKFSNEIWIGIKPESRGHVGVTIRTDRKSDFSTKDTDSYLMDFFDIDFRDISFDVNRSPQIHRHKLKAKKFVYYKLSFVSDDAFTGATVLDANIKVRYTGYAK